MKDFKHIEPAVEETLRSLDGLKTASPGPFFFTRVQARLNRSERNVWEKLSMLLSRPTVAIAGICLIIFINTLTVLDLKDTAPSLAEQNEPIYDEEYNMAVTSFYDIENTEP
jgi:hypothetical protein